jgi:pimeloyl-ACP methyl ester carboxylesterase
MGYTSALNDFKNIDILTSGNVDFANADLKIRTLNFHSSKVELFQLPNHPDVLLSANKEEAVLSDSDDINANFTYPIFLPNGEKKYDKVIVLLHGLNERSWMKYMPWADELARSTNSAVILFPISYHINRSPKEWADPRAMISVLNDCNMRYGKADCSSFVNIALSRRLLSDPLRFFTSGYQSANDLVGLLEQIRVGSNPYVRDDAQVDFFAYSIGAFLSQILFIANPNNIVSNSRLFMFCGGAFFNEMNGVSKMIMDEASFRKIFSYYNDEFEKESVRQTRLGLFIKDNRFAMAFRSMLNMDRLKDFRCDMFSKFKGQVYAISLLKDKVISPTGISSFFRSIGSKNIEMVDFAFPHSHEQPFPIIGKPTISDAVDGGFKHVFRRAASFLG